MPEGTRELRLVVTAPDYDAALRFYRDILGLREEASFADDNGGRATLMHAGRATIELGDAAHAEAIDGLEVGRRVAGPVRLAFDVGDAEATTERLLAAGGQLVAPAVRTPWGSVNARVDGPDGLQLTIYSNDIYLSGRPRLDGPVELADPDPAWAATATDLASDVRSALGSAALVLEHVGSTAVPGLAAKPCIDLVLAVPDPGDESAYVPALEGLGYRLHLREPEWHEHRLLNRAEPAVNLHVFAAGSVEIDRMVAFRDHLCRDAADRDLYMRTKRELASRTWSYTQDYADAKTDVVEAILARAMHVRETGSLRGLFVVVSGATGSTKTSLAKELAPLLGLPLLSKDTVTEALLDHLGAKDLGEARALGSAAVAVLLALARESGGGVLDAPWRRDRVADLASLGGRLVEVFCRVDRDTAARRDLVREPRHPGHFDARRDSGELWDEVSDPVAGGWPVIEQDTTTPVDVQQLVRRIHHAAARV